MSNSAVIHEGDEKKSDVMSELLNDFDKKNKAMATTREKKEVQSPEPAIKSKKPSNEGRKYGGYIKHSQKSSK